MNGLLDGCFLELQGGVGGAAGGRGGWGKAKAASLYLLFI